MIKISIIFLFVVSILNAENIAPYSNDAQYAWSENTGWLNFEPDVGSGMQVQNDKVTGFIWAENIGWINFFNS